MVGSNERIRGNEHFILPALLKKYSFLASFFSVTGEYFKIITSQQKVLHLVAPSMLWHSNEVVRLLP
jgi:hypothetical protein